jgi:hypothetical protein
MNMLNIKCRFIDKLPNLTYFSLRAYLNPSMLCCKLGRSDKISVVVHLNIIRAGYEFIGTEYFCLFVWFSFEFKCIRNHTPCAI